MQSRKRKMAAAALAALMTAGMAGCSGASAGETVSAPASQPEAESAVSAEAQPASEPSAEAETPILIAEQVLEGETGSIHYSYYLPAGCSEEESYPLVMTMPGYDMMWFGEDSSGSNLNWGGFTCWNGLDEKTIVVSAQLTDWGETSARQANELTEYFIENFPVDTSRVYGAGYSAGGETMSRAVSMRPDLYAAYLHAASQWDGEYAPVAENGVAVYIFMAEGDEYYGSDRARAAYDGLYEAYRDAGWTEDEIDGVLQVQIPDAGWFAGRGVTGNYHGGGNVLFEEPDILNWILSQEK